MLSPTMLPAVSLSTLTPPINESVISPAAISATISPACTLKDEKSKFPAVTVLKSNVPPVT